MQMNNEPKIPHRLGPGWTWTAVVTLPESTKINISDFPLEIFFKVALDEDPHLRKNTKKEAKRNKD